MYKSSFSQTKASVRAVPSPSEMIRLAVVHLAKIRSSETNDSFARGLVNVFKSPLASLFRNYTYSALRTRRPRSRQ